MHMLSHHYRVDFGLLYFIIFQFLLSLVRSCVILCVISSLLSLNSNSILLVLLTLSRNSCAIHAGRVTIMKRDLELAHRLANYF